MSRFRAGAARRIARLCCDEVDGSRAAGNRSSTPLPRFPVGPLAGRRPSGTRRTALEQVAPAGGRQRRAAEGVRTGARSGLRRLVRPARSCAARAGPGSARPLHRGDARGRRDDARRGRGPRARVAVAPDLSPGRRGRRQAAWLQFCPLCLAEDAQPYFRRDWRLATTIACARHGGRLLDRCPPRGQGLAPFAQDSPRPQSACAACGCDLAAAKAPRLGPAAQRPATNLADLGRSATDANPALVDAILALPAKLDPRAPALTALPTSDRARALPALARAPVRRPGRRERRPKAEIAGAAAGVLAVLARRLRHPAPPALRALAGDRRRRTILVLT